MKAIWVVIIVIAIIVIIGYIYAKKIISNFDFGIPKFQGADLGSIFSNGGFATIDLSTTIVNNNNFSIPVSNLYIEVYYLDALIGKSTTPHDNFTIPKNGSITITQNMTLALNNSLGIAAKIVSKQTVEFQYVVKATIFTIYPLRISGKFTY